MIAAAVLGIWPAAEPASAAANVRDMELGGLVYVAAWALARRRAWRPVVIWSLVAAGTAYGAWLIVQYRYLAPPEVKVAALDAIGRAVSAPFPPLLPWAPFANSSATLLEGLVVVAAGLALGRGTGRDARVGGGRGGRDGGGVPADAPRVAPGWRSPSALAVLVAYRYIARWQVAIAAVAVARPARRGRRHGERRHARGGSGGPAPPGVPIGSTSTDRR